MKHAESYWAATVAFGEPRSPLASDVQCDVVIVGGGFTGLSAAYHLQSMGVSTVVLEQNRVGWGASGRNGGHLLVGFKREQAFLEKHFDYQTWTLDKGRMDEELGSAAYHGVHVDPHGASFHPLNYALGLADGVEDLAEAM